MSRKNSSTAEKLLEAHVRFVLGQLEGASLKAVIEREVDALLDTATKVTLNEAVTPDMIKQTVRHYAVELELGGAIPELVGDVARIVYAHAAHDDTRLGDIVSDRQFSEMLDKVLEMKELRQRLIHETTSNPLYAALASDILFHGIRGYLMKGPLTRSIPGARSMIKLGSSVIGLAGFDEDSLKRYIRKNIRATLKESERFLTGRISDERIRDFVLDIWDVLKKRRLSWFRHYVSSNDVEEWFVIGYQYWRDELRGSEYYIALIDAGIDAFFEKYGDTALKDILDEIGIRREMLLADAMRFAPPVIKALNKKKLLEPIVRRNLEGFYQSEEAAAILL